MEKDFLASGNRFLLFRSFSPWWKPSLKLVEANFKRKSIFKLMKIDFLASGNHIFFHFSRQQSTATTGSSFFFSWNIFFSQSIISFSKNEFFAYWKQYFFISSFFLQMGNIIEIWRNSFFKDEPYCC